MSEPAAKPSILISTANRMYSIERFYSLVAGATEDRICICLRDDLQNDALHAAYAIEAWLEEVNGREEKYDRLANMARAIAPISDLLRTLSTGAFNDCSARLIHAYEQNQLQNYLAQRYELRQSASEIEEGDSGQIDGDLLTALLEIVNEPEGRDDYVAWFQIGWLQWKKNVLDQAESAFRTAASFSQRHSSWYFAQSLRHEAYVQWCRGNTERARATSRRALEVRRDPSMLVEAARYAISGDQQLESQSMLDEAFHTDPLMFVSVLADPAFSSAITSTIDILVRQQMRSNEDAKDSRNQLESVINSLRLAEKQGGIALLPRDADQIFAGLDVSFSLDFPTAIYRKQQCKELRSEWSRNALDAIRVDVASKKQAVEEVSEQLRTAKLGLNSQLDSIDAEQRLAEVAVQNEHAAVQLPVVPVLKNEVMYGLALGLSVLAIGTAILAGLSQWKFGTIPPLVPISKFDMIVISPILIVMFLFGLLGVVSIPAIRLGIAKRKYYIAASAADELADHKLRVIANEGTRKREIAKSEWTKLEQDLNARINEAQKLMRASMLAHGTVKEIIQ